MISVTNNYKVNFTTAVWLWAIRVPNLWFLHLSDFFFFILAGNITAKFSVTDF